MFSKNRCKFHKRLNHVIRLRLLKVIGNRIFLNLLNNYKHLNFCHKLITILHALPKCLLKIAWDVSEGYLLEDKIPSSVGTLIRDFTSFRNKLHLDNIEDKLEEVRNNDSCFLKLIFHNKGIEMIDLPGILHNKKVLRTVPSFVQHIIPPIVS